MRLFQRREATQPLLQTLLLTALGVVLSACSTGTPQAESPKGAHETEFQDDTKEETKAPPPPQDVVPAAARPFRGYRPIDQKEFDEESLLTHLAAADAICIGERHDQVLDHYAQLRVLQGLTERKPIRGFELGLALEMVRQYEQPTLRAFGEKRINTAEFVELANWGQEWGFPIEYYVPQLEHSQENGVALIGLGVDRDLTRKVAEVGIVGLDGTKQARLPELDRSIEAHRKMFDALMEGHPGDASTTDGYYEAQLIWDEEMAQRSAAWLQERTPGRKLIIMAGRAHCHRTAIPDRIQRRTGYQVVSLLPVDNGSPRSVSSDPKTAEEHLIAGYDYQMVFTP